MFSSYLTAAIRSLYKRKGQTAISILGLATGLVCCILISLWVSGELSYDQFHQRAGDLYQLTHHRGRLTPTALAPHLKEQLPEVEDATRFHYRRWQIGNDTESSNGQVRCVDPSFLNMFSFELLQGDPTAVLATANSIVLTESFAHKLFGDESPIGKTVSIEKGEELTVTGIMKDAPFNSRIQFDGLVNVDFLNVIFAWFPPMDSWTDGDMETYLLLTPGAAPGMVRDKIQAITDSQGMEMTASLEPFASQYLYGSRRGNPRIVYVYILIGAAILILLSACVNYVNIATARAIDRAREVGIRKVVGANRSDLIRQFIGETVLVALISAAVAVFVVELIQPQFELLVGHSIAVKLTGNPMLLVGMAGVVLITGVAAGIYPALVLSSFRPLKVLRSSTGTSTGRPLVRRMLVVGQFAVSIFLFAGAVVVYSQMDYIADRDLGYDHEAILYLPLQSDIYQKLGPLVDDLGNQSEVTGMTFTNTLPDRAETSTDDVTWEGQPDGKEVFVRVQTGGYSFAKVFGIEMTEGRFFSQDFPTDIEEGFIINETAVAAMELEDPVGKRFSLMGREGSIVGVVKDFNFRSLHYAIQPLVITIRPGWSDNLAIKVQPGNIGATADAIQAIVKKYVPDYPTEVQFYDAKLAGHYRSEKRITRLLSIAAGLAVLMSCLGLIGLVSYSVRRRAREIGIRKVLGSSSTNIVRLITMEFVAAVGLACLVAWPLALWATSRWLDSFAYATEVSWVHLALAGGVTLGMALVTAGFYAIRAALANPGRALRCE
jgi:ABC-type antimicrobial peptide transport system permease subunit